MTYTVSSGTLNSYYNIPCAPDTPMMMKFDDGGGGGGSGDDGTVQ